MIKSFTHNGRTIIATESGIIMTPGGKIPEPRSTVPQQNGGTKWVPWGDDNLFPQRVVEAASKSTVIAPAIDRKARLSYAGGIQIGRKQYIDNKEVFVPEKYPLFEEFKRKNNLNRYLMEAFSDLYWFVNFYPNLILSLDRNQIVQLFIEEACHCRWEWQNPENGLVENCFLSANWDRDPNVDLITVPVIDPYWDAAGQLKNRKDGFRFVYPVSYPSPGKHFYQLAAWNGAISSGWLEYSIQIPEFKTWMMKNQISLKYHLEVNEEYWPNMYDGWANFTAEEQRLHKSAFVEDFNKQLSGQKNAMKTLLTGFYYDKSGEERIAWRVTSIDDKIKSGVYVEDSSEAVAHLCNALDIDPQLFPHIQGKGQTAGSGSDINASYNLFMASIKPYHDLVLEPLYVIRDYNGWDSDLEFQIGITFMSSMTSGKPTAQPAN